MSPLKDGLGLLVDVEDVWIIVNDDGKVYFQVLRIGGEGEEIYCLLKTKLSFRELLEKFKAVVGEPTAPIKEGSC